ncbi:hypothetical protein U1Q18_015617 [Sarracenia purpurea var. burkii]
MPKLTASFARTPFRVTITVALTAIFSSTYLASNYPSNLFILSTTTTLLPCSTTHLPPPTPPNSYAANAQILALASPTTVQHALSASTSTVHPNSALSGSTSIATLSRFSPHHSAATNRSGAAFAPILGWVSVWLARPASL